MAERFFRDKKKKTIQKQNTWRYIATEIDNLLLNNNIVIFDWFSLPKTKYFALCNQKILIKSDDEIRKKRILKRDNLSLDYLELREKDQLQYNEDDYDHIIFNNDKNLKEKTKKLITKMNL